MKNADLMILAVATEADINELDNFDDRKAFLDDIGLSLNQVHQSLLKNHMTY